MPMLWAIAILFMAIWVAALVSHVTVGGFIHLLPLLSAVTLLVRFVQGRRVT